MRAIRSETGTPAKHTANFSGWSNTAISAISPPWLQPTTPTRPPSTNGRVSTAQSRAAMQSSISRPP